MGKSSRGHVERSEQLNLSLWSMLVLKRFVERTHRPRTPTAVIMRIAKNVLRWGGRVVFLICLSDGKY